MVNWTEMIDHNVNNVIGFANGSISGRTFYNCFKCTPAGGTARKLLRKHGVVYGRRLARKALSRRVK